MHAALLSSVKMDYETPEVVLNLVRQWLGPIGLDPCTSKANPCMARLYLDSVGLGTPWASTVFPHELVYVNPPYGRGIRLWVDKCIDEAVRGAEIVLLVPSRTDTGWYAAADRHSNAKCSWLGRLTFRGALAPAPFPSALFYWGHRPYLFCHAFQKHGRVRVIQERRAA